MAPRQAHLTPEVQAALATKILQREGDMRRILLEEGTGIVEALKAVRGPLFGLYLAAVDVGDGKTAAGLAGGCMRAWRSREADRRVDAACRGDDHQRPAVARFYAAARRSAARAVAVSRGSGRGGGAVPERRRARGGRDAGGDPKLIEAPHAAA